MAQTVTQPFDNSAFGLDLATATVGLTRRASPFAWLTPNQRELAVRKLTHLSALLDHGDNAHRTNRFYDCEYVKPERLALSVERLVSFIAGVPLPSFEYRSLELRLWSVLDSERRMEENNARIRAERGYS